MPNVLPSPDQVNLASFKEFAKIRLIAADLDGTLIQSSNPEIWNNVLLMIRNLRAPKYKLEIVIATGRTLTGAMNTIESLYLQKNLPIILYNGSVVVRQGDYSVLYKKSIEKETLKLISSKFTSYKVSIFAYYYLDSTEFLFDDMVTNEYVLGWTFAEQFEYEFNKMKINWNPNKHYLDFDPSAILIDISKENEENIEKIKRELDNIQGITITSSGFSYIEIRPMGSDKAKALEFVANYLKLSKPEILAIGDNDNDAEMLEWAGIGVSISTATDKAKKNSDYLCSHNVVSGVLEALRFIKSAKRYHNYYEKNI